MLEGLPPSNIFSWGRVGGEAAHTTQKNGMFWRESASQKRFRQLLRAPGALSSRAYANRWQAGQRVAGYSQQC